MLFLISTCHISNTQSKLTFRMDFLRKALWIPTLFCNNSTAQPLKLKSNLYLWVPIMYLYFLSGTLFVCMYICMYIFAPDDIYPTSQTKHFEEKFYKENFYLHIMWPLIYILHISNYHIKWKKCLLLTYDIFSLYLKNSPAVPT